jgi:hypothetical protein
MQVNIIDKSAEQPGFFAFAAKWILVVDHRTEGFNIYDITESAGHISNVAVVLCQVRIFSRIFTMDQGNILIGSIS